MFKRKGEFKPFENKIWLASPTMHGEELGYLDTRRYMVERSGCKNIILREDYLLSLIAEMIGASDEKTCAGIEQIFVFSNGRLEVEMMEE